MPKDFITTPVKPEFPLKPFIFDRNGLPISSSSLHPDGGIEYEAYKIISPAKDRGIPLIVSCPHAGIYLPRSLMRDLADGITLKDVIERGDMFTDWLTVNAPNFGATQVISTVAPSYLNVGRSVTSIHPADVPGGLSVLEGNPNDVYVRESKGQGLVAVKSLYTGQFLYRTEHAPNEGEIRQRIDTFYTPFHTALTQQVEQNLQAHTYSFLFDIHSCPSVGTPADTDTGLKRPDIIFGDNDGKSCSPELTQSVMDLAKNFGFSVDVNGPYKGGFNTQKFAAQPTGNYQNQTFGKRGSESLQIEFNRDSFGLNEKTLELEDREKFQEMSRFTNALLVRVASYAQKRSRALAI